MIYIYDGSLDGFLTVVFDSYKVIESVDKIATEKTQIDFFEDKIRVDTDLEKSNRVKKSIANRFSHSFYRDIIKVYSSYFEDKEIVIAKTLKKLYTKGFSYIGSADDDIVKFKDILKRFTRELHSYKGLLRFNEKDGVLFSEINPENDILYYIYNHFSKRLKNEKFIIADIKRKKAVFYNGSKVEFFDFIKDKDLKIEDEYVKLWCDFYDSISIKERKNEKLRIQNMPKKYWKNLPEMNRLN